MLWSRPRPCSLTNFLLTYLKMLFAYIETCGINVEAMNDYI